MIGSTGYGNNGYTTVTALTKKNRKNPRKSKERSWDGTGRKPTHKDYDGQLLSLKQKLLCANCMEVYVK